MEYIQKRSIVVKFLLVRHKPVAISQITRMYVCSPMFTYHVYYLNKKHFYYHTTAKTELSVLFSV